MTGTALVSSIVSIIVSGLSEIGSGIGLALSSMAKAIFLETVGEGSSATTSLSLFGTLIIVFAAISLGFGLTRWVLNFITSLGNRNK